MMKSFSIHTIHWDRVPTDCINSWSWVHHHFTVYAIWPAPVPPDDCFLKAGFDDFTDTDDCAWDDELDEIVTSMITTLSQYGTPIITRGKPLKPILTVLKGLIERIFDKHSELGNDESPEELMEALLSPIYNDNFPECVIEFGSKPIASVRAYYVHPILWMGLTDSAAKEIAAIVDQVASNRSVRRTSLDWNYLAI